MGRTHVRPSHTRRILAGLGAAALGALTPLAPAVPAAAAGTTPEYTLRIVNNTGVDPAEVFVTLVSSTGTYPAPSVLPAGLEMNTPYPLDPLVGATPWSSDGGNAYSVDLGGPWSSGVVLYSLGNGGRTFAGYAVQPTAGSNTNQYDISELTISGTGTDGGSPPFSFNGDLSSVNQVGIPGRLSILGPDGALADRNGTGQTATEYVGCVDATKSVMERTAGSWSPSASGAWRTKADGSFLEIAGPGAGTLYTTYPSYQQYVQSLAGRTLTVRGHFGGNTQPPVTQEAYYEYSGTVQPDGSILLSGTLADKADGTGTTNYPDPQSIYVPGSELYGSDWGKTGYGIYAQNGPYVVQQGTGTPPTPTPATNWIDPNPATGWQPDTPGYYEAIGNDVYGWIYADLVASFSMGYWGSDATGAALFDSASWNTNASPPWGNSGTAGLPAFAAAWANPYPGYALFNVYENAVQTTGNTYGSAFSDRFAPPGTTSPELAVTAADPADMGTWQVELLARDGCAQIEGVSPQSGPASGGQVVTITGRNFHQGASVTFGGVPATGVSVSHDPTTSLSTISATAPAGPPGARVPVQVTNAFGSAATGIDSSTLAGAYVYQGGGGALPGGGGAGPGGQGGPTPRPLTPGVSTGGGVRHHPGGGCALTVTVARPVASRATRAPRAVVPAQDVVSLEVHGLPWSGPASVDVRRGRSWTFLGRTRVTGSGVDDRRDGRRVRLADGRATLPRISITTPGSRLTLRIRDGRTTRYVAVVAGRARDTSGRRLSADVRAYPGETCPARGVVVRRALGRAPGRAPQVIVRSGVIVTLRVHGLPRDRPAHAQIRIGRRWEDLGTVRSDRQGRAVLPPIDITASGSRFLVRLRGGEQPRYLRIAVR